MHLFQFPFHLQQKYTINVFKYVHAIFLHRIQNCTPILQCVIGESAIELIVTSLRRHSSDRRTVRSGVQSLAGIASALSSVVTTQHEKCMSHIYILIAGVVVG